jgi:hypothetical protein
MKATLEFDLNDSEDIIAHKRCVKALDMAISLHEILNHFRTQLKYGDYSGEAYEVIEKCQADVIDILNSNSIDIDELIR